MEPKQLYREFIDTSDVISIEKDTINVTLDRRAHNPIMAQAKLDAQPVSIPWLGDKNYNSILLDSGCILCRDNWRYIQMAYGLVSRYDRLRNRGMLTMTEMAERFKVDPATVKSWN